jgi:hypothetical protein
MDIAYKSELKFLGIYITENLKWSIQVKSSSPKLSKVCYFIKSLKEAMSPYMISIYYAHFHALLKYGIIFWGGYNESNNQLTLWHQNPKVHLCIHNSQPANPIVS